MHGVIGQRSIFDNLIPKAYADSDSIAIFEARLQIGSPVAAALPKTGAPKQKILYIFLVFGLFGAFAFIIKMLAKEKVKRQ